MLIAIIGEINLCRMRISRSYVYVHMRAQEKLMYYPAAMSNHHAEYGGLLLSHQAHDDAPTSCARYTMNLSRDLLVAGVAIHDNEKFNEILSGQERHIARLFA